MTDITWFEARAYAQWLSGQLRETLYEAGLNGYYVRLPTEPQWERAARAKNLIEMHIGRWPWGDDASTIAQRANVGAAGIAHASSVGLFAPNAIGLHDMAGNVWEWMDNRFDSSKGKGFDRVQPVERYEQIAEDYMSLRGGSCVDHPELASCSYRLRYLPDKSLNGFGVRVVLSQADKAKLET